MAVERRRTRTKPDRVLKMVRLIPEVDAAVFSLAKAHNCSMNAMINTLLDHAAKTYRHEPDSHSEPPSR